MPKPDDRGDSQDSNGMSPSLVPDEDDLVASESRASSKEEHSSPLRGFQSQRGKCTSDDNDEVVSSSHPTQVTKEEMDQDGHKGAASLDRKCLKKSCGSENGFAVPDMSEFERVWETNDLIDKPVPIASAETLTSSGTSRSHTSSYLPHSRSLGTASSAPPPRDDRSSSVKRSFSFAESSALKTPSSRSEAKSPTNLRRSSSYRGVPIDICPLHDTPCEKTLHVNLHTREVELHVRLPQMEVEPRSLTEYPHAVTNGSTSSPPEEPPDHGSDRDSVRRCQKRRPCSFSSGIGEPSVYHALVVIFLEFFAWGLLTSPMILVLKTTFPDHTFLMNGLIMGIKGILSFLSAPLIGAVSDAWGRKFFLFITVFFTCLPIPFMKINTWWYFALISMSGMFAVTYSIVFAYVADVTDPSERHHAYGLVSATFAASLVTSPALGAYLSQVHSDDLVVGLATAIAVLDIFFILVAVPESLPEKLRIPSTWSTTISWEQADPFTSLWKVSQDRNILLISVTVFLSYLPEAGQLSCFFVYLQLVMGFGPEMVATFIAVVGIMSVVAQTALLSLLIRTLSNKRVISVGLVFELLQLIWYGFGSQAWMMWAAGILAAISSITYPAISAYISTHTDIDKQGVVQGIVTGMRGLCAGLGPAVFGFIFYLFHVDLNQGTDQNTSLLGVGGGSNNSSLMQGHHVSTISHQVPGPPFVFGAMLVILAIAVSTFIPEGNPPKNRKQSVNALDLGYNRDHKKTDSLDGTSQPLMNESGVL